MRVEISKGIPQKVILKAMGLVEQIEQGQHVKHTIIKMRSTRYKSIKVGLYYRLLVKENKILLIHHEQYNKHLGR